MLPTEILSKIASYTENRNECSKVCRPWLTGFQPYLYQHIHITSRRQLKQLIQTIHNHVELGRHVKHLNIAYHVGLTRDEFEILDFYFPLLQSLNFNPKLWKYQRRTDRKDWKRIAKLPPLNLFSLNLHMLQHYGQSLTHLTLAGGLVNQLHGQTRLIPLFQFTPHLKHLKMFGRDKFTAITHSQYAQTRFTYNDVLDIHALLPNLEALELLDVVLALQSELKRMTFPKVHQFQVGGKFAHHAWVALVAQLYPNLRQLELNVSWDETYRRDMAYEDFQAVRVGLVDIATTCRYLETVRLVSLGAVVKDAHQLFYKTLFKSSTKGLSSIDGIMVSSLMELKQLANAILQCCDSEHTHTLRLQLWRDLGSVKNMMAPVAQCHRLKELELMCGKFSYAWNYGCDIDAIATYCPQLVVLKLTMTRMTVSKGYKQTACASVETIHLNQVHFTTESMNALSNCFPKLKHFNIWNSVKERDNLDQMISINLNNQTLETLSIDKLYLRPSQYVEKSGIDAALFSVEMAHRNMREERRVGKNGGARWYHLYHENGSRQLKKLAHTKSQKIQCYQMKESDWDTISEGSIRGTYRKSKHWENDVPFGYVFITCNLISNLALNKVLL
ncbi:uncharacterized protein EV154DRAFT_504661 [Mucor mucedo]|uniref:uncharacterized protein n=1 Tax=Mucor mucedo TaxID=29922 RepID=UPI00221EF629|nr:uncharacterized protein EV154DRAFT_504661 [Mucor mucedo]KAI7892508.1 hypothetical protein EV154DRAFT_504661 [Mucor mucedo]